MDLLRASLLAVFASPTRLARICAYSLCRTNQLEIWDSQGEDQSYSSVFGSFGLSTLESHAVTLVLQTLRSDETLDARGFFVWFLAFSLGLDFAADDVAADLIDIDISSWSITLPIVLEKLKRTSSSLVRPKNLRILVALLGPNRLGIVVSVKPGMSSSPCLTMLRAKTLKSIPTMQPLTLFLLRSPVRRGR